MPVYADDPLRTLESEPRPDIRPDSVRVETPCSVAVSRADEHAAAARAKADLEAAATRRRAIELALGKQLRRQAQARMDPQRAAGEANLATEQGT